MIVAKFVCDSVTNLKFGVQNIEATPVVSGSEENKSFAALTPSGKLELCITNPAAQHVFIAGDEYRLTIEHVPKEK